MKPLDRTGKIFLVACAVLFLLGVFFRLNGSSVFIWKQLLHDPSDTGGLVLAAPQPARTDEWMIWTPAARWQSEHGFPSENPSLGPGKTAFLYSLPVRHYTTVLRPQLWGFFLFSFERGYAWYWNAKIFGLLAATFVFFRMLTGRSPLGVFGALWLFFSNYVQWWFSCPPMLPEMLSSWAMALVAALILLRTTRWPIRISASVGLIFAVTNFVLCLYPPFQIPLGYLGLALFVALVYRQRQEMHLDWRSLSCLLAVLGSILALLLPYFLECRTTFQSLAQTSYPGQRRSHGGELSWIQLFSGLANFFNSPASFPARLKSAIDAANFLPLWLPVLILVGSRLWQKPREHLVAIAALLVIVGFSLYALLPLPDWFCGVTGLRYCTGIRALLTIGVANIIFVTLSMPSLALAARRHRVAEFIAVSLGAILYLASATRTDAMVLSSQTLVFLVCDLALLLLLFTGRVQPLAVALVALLVASNALVNPVMQGLGPLTASPPAEAIQQLTKEDPDGIWASFDASAYSEFLMAQGANVVSGLKLLPNATFYDLTDPAGASRDIYNRYSIATFRYRQDRERVDFQSSTFPTHLVSINPLHRVFVAMGVRYFVFDQEIARPEQVGLKLRRALPANRLWIYRRDSGGLQASAVTSRY